MIADAKTRASADVLEVGIDVQETSINFKCQVVYESASTSSDTDLEYLFDPDDKDNDVDEFDTLHVQAFENLVDESDAELSKDLHSLSSIVGPLNLKHHTYSGIDLTETSPYCVVCDCSGTGKPVRKSTICWLLSRNKHTLSSDRLTRVKQSELVSKSESFFTSTQ